MEQLPLYSTNNNWRSIYIKHVSRTTKKTQLIKSDVRNKRINRVKINRGTNDER